MNSTIFRYEFGILFAGALVGGLAVMPYGLKLLKASSQPLKMSVRKLSLLSFLQTVILSAIAIGIGLRVAHSIGLGVPYIDPTIAGKGTIQVANTQ